MRPMVVSLAAWAPRVSGQSIRLLTVGFLLLAAPQSGLSATFPLAPGTGDGTAVLKVATPAEPDGYRMGAYRAPTPATISGATVVSTEEARRLWERKAAIFIDVLPSPPKPENLPEDVIWRVPPRYNIPESVWLANVGFGALAAEVESYFRSNLARLAKDGKDTSFLFYCLADCWMSWNAARRALEFGYTAVYWYPEGTDGWAAAGGELARDEPVPMVP